MWFKRGDQDAEQQEDAEEAVAAPVHDPDHIDEERYQDDGTLTRRDQERYNLRTGSTSSVPAIPPAPRAATMSERALLAEIESARTLRIMLMCALVIVALAIGVSVWA